jgi:cytochrome P450
MSDATIQPPAVGDASISAARTPKPGWYGFVFDAQNVQTEDPYTQFRELREQQPVNLTPDGTWRLSRYEDVHRLFRNVPSGMRRHNGLLPGQEVEEPGAGIFMLLQDPPNHTRLRKLVSKAFTPRAIEAWRPRVEAITEGLLDRVATAGTMDLVADLALPVPATLICEMLGVPVEDQGKFTQWTTDATHGLAVIRGGGDDDIRARVEVAGMSLMNYFNSLIAERRGEDTGDLLSTLITAEEDGEKLSEIELLSQSIGLLIAGFETTIGLIGNGLTTLIRNPDEIQKLRAHPELIESAVEECLRFSGPIVATVRVLHAAAEFGDYVIPDDAEVIALIAAANRDPEAFEDPERFDVTRYEKDRYEKDQSAAPHFSFGGGVHFCLGAHLARLETQIAIGAIVRRFDNLRLVDEKTEWGRSLFRVPGRIPVTFSDSPA